MSAVPSAPPTATTTSLAPTTAAPRLPGRLLPGTLAFLAVILLPALLLAVDQPGAGLPEPTVDAETGVRWYRDVPYLEDEEADPVKHRLDLFLPAEAEWHPGRPMVVWIHGGGWSMGDKDDAMGLYRRYCRLLAESGIGAANLNYRLTPTVRHPGHVEDVAAATAWLLRHADDLGFDRSAIFLSGHSAGAHLAALLATDPRWLAEHGLAPGAIAGVIGSSGVYDLRMLIEWNPRWQRIFPAEQAAAASPITHIDAHVPPFALIIEEHGAFLRRQTTSMADALRDVGIEPAIAEIRGVNHITMIGDLLRRNGVHVTTTLRFIDEVLRSRDEANAKEGGRPDAHGVAGDSLSAR